jgi:hypothetical protein
MFDEGWLKRFRLPEFLGQKEAEDRPDPEFREDGSQEYEVEEILDKWVMGEGIQYHIRWKGYGPEDDTWEPQDRLTMAWDAVCDHEA